MRSQNAFTVQFKGLLIEWGSRGDKEEEVRCVNVPNQVNWKIYNTEGQKTKKSKIQQNNNRQLQTTP